MNYNIRHLVLFALHEGYRSAIVELVPPCQDLLEELWWVLERSSASPDSSLYFRDWRSSPCMWYTVMAAIPWAGEWEHMANTLHILVNQEAGNGECWHFSDTFLFHSVRFPSPWDYCHSHSVGVCLPSLGVPLWKFKDMPSGCISHCFTRHF